MHSLAQFLQYQLQYPLAEEVEFFTGSAGEYGYLNDVANFRPLILLGFDHPFASKPSSYYCTFECAIKVKLTNDWGPSNYIVRDVNGKPELTVLDVAGHNQSVTLTISNI